MDIEKCFERLKRISEIVNYEVDNEINRILQEDCKLFDILESVPYALSSEGKRKRSVMIYLCYLLKKENFIQDLKHLAVFVELIQTASLIHDDIMDNSSLRWDKETINKKYGVNTAIITGDYLIFKAFNLLSNLDIKYYKKINKILGEAFEKMCYGQELEKKFIGNVEITLSEYYEMIYMKTAIFIEKVCEVSLILADAKEYEIEAIKAFGRYYGIAYQIKDDIKFFLDEKRDKSLESDIDKRLVTLPIIYALKNASIEDKGYLNNVYNLKKEIDYIKIRKTVIESGAIKYAMNDYDKYLNKAAIELKKIKSTEIVNTILMFINRKEIEEVEKCLI